MISSDAVCLSFDVFGHDALEIDRSFVLMLYSVGFTYLQHLSFCTSQNIR